MIKSNQISIFFRFLNKHSCANAGRTGTGFGRAGTSFSRRRTGFGRAGAGFGMVEAFTSAIFLVVAVIVSLDCWFMIMAARINDSACRDASRAAAQAGDSVTDATNAALAAAQSYSSMGTGMMVSTPTITILGYNNTTAATQSPSGLTVPPLSVIVQSTCTVKTLLPISMLGSGNNTTFTEQKTYPIIPSTTGVQANNITGGGSG